MAQMMNYFKKDSNQWNNEAQSLPLGSQFSLDDFSSLAVSFHEASFSDQALDQSLSSVKINTEFGDTIKSDSGYSEFSAASKKESRWLKMSEALLHKDIKLFLKKNYPSSKDSRLIQVNRRSALDKVTQFLEDIDSGDEFECIAKLSVKAMGLKADKAGTSTKNLMILH